ncbi:hypothetical protein [Streptomyces sp. NRRL B-24572]|uniref:hypothetical protein n=1 Tax=Streptomyces sp. NRRL B-24572 TaxID=1962156 RepID=UPI000A3A6EB9|nr:hypothetical protein [Streptomyces sp. NRRL B-24572]
MEETDLVHRQWGNVSVLRQWLDQEQPEPVREVRMARVLAVGTSYGVAAQALNGALGLNPGPIPTHSWDDVREALADVAAAALVALDTIAGEPEHILAARLDELAARVPRDERP